MRELNLDAVAKQLAPQHAHLFALRDAIGRDEAAAYAFARGVVLALEGNEDVFGAVRLLAETHVLELLLVAAGETFLAAGQILRSLEVPAAHIVQNTDAFEIVRGDGEVLLLFFGLVLLADERRIAEDVVQPRWRHEFLPIQPQRIAEANVRRLDERNAREIFAGLATRFDVHLMVGQPHRHLCDLGRKLLDLDAVELVHVDLQGARERAFDRGAELARCLKHLEFQPPQLPVSDDEKISAAASRIEEILAREILVKFEQRVLVVLCARELGAQVVQKQRADQLENVRFRRVMRAELTAAVFGFELDDFLEHRAEDGRRDRTPLQRAAVQQELAHRGVEFGNGEPFLEQFAVDMGKGRKDFGQRFLPQVALLVERLEQLGEQRAGIAAVFFRARFEQIEKAVLRRKQARVVGEQAEQDAHEKDLQRVSGVAVALQGIVQFAEPLHGADIGLGLDAERDLLITGDEAEQLNMLGKIGEREFLVGLLVDVVQTNAPEVGHHDIARQVVVGEPSEIIRSLRERRIEIGAGALVFG